MSAGSSTRVLPGSSDSALIEAAESRSSRVRSSESTSIGAHPLRWMGIGLLFIAGFFGISPELERLWEIWTTDSLRSIGMLIMPAGMILILLAWRELGWELRGRWWGLLPIALAFSPLIFSYRLEFSWAGHGERINFIPSVFPIYLYVAGVVLLFAGLGVWRRAWFPLILLLCAQPVPEIIVRTFDLPMQGIAASIARSFAHSLGLSPTSTELLRLMFAPNFGMFIAPGCDGMRGAITLGYGALIVGYVKRMPIAKWGACVVGAILLGHLLNLARLCALVAYYKIAMGNPRLENWAKQADYVIGAVLFLVGALLFLWFAQRAVKHKRASNIAGPIEHGAQESASTYWKAGAFALLVLAVLVPGVRAASEHPRNLLMMVHQGEITVDQLNDKIPGQFGAFRRVRVWQEDLAGSPVLEAAAFNSGQSNEIELGIWLPASDHSIRASLMTHGDSPKSSALKEYVTERGRSVLFNTALYDDGITQTLIGDTYCSPSSCQPSFEGMDGIRLGITKIRDYPAGGQRAIPIFFKIQAPHTSASVSATYEELSAQCEQFLARVDFTQLSGRFQ